MQNWLKKIIRGCLYLALLTPIFVSKAFVFPFVFPKTALFQIFIEIALAAWIFLLFLEPAYRPRFTFLTKIISLWLVVLFFTSLLGVNFYRSLWGSYERMTGLIALLHYFAFFLILKSFLKTEKEWLNIFNASILVSLIVSAIGFLQKFGALTDSTDSRIAASFGNPSYLAAYLIFNIFFISFLLYKRWSYLEWRFAYFTALFFELLILFWTATRGAFLALAVVFFVFIIIFFLIPPKRIIEIQSLSFKKIKLVLLAFFLMLVLSVGFFWTNHESAWVKGSPVLSRLSSISLSDVTSQVRLLTWRMAYDGWRDKFLFGWGWENFNIVFNKFYNPLLYPNEIWFDRAHNIILDTVTTSGLLGLLAYLGIFLACFVILKKSFRENKIGFLGISIFSFLLAAYFIQNLFIFDMIDSYLMFFLFLGFIGFIETSSQIQNNLSLSKDKQKLIVRRIPSWIQAVIIFLLFLSIYFLNIKPALASYYTIQALESAAKAEIAGRYDQNKILAAFEKSLNYGTFGYGENSLRLAEYALGLVNKDKVSNDDLKNVFDLAISKLERTTKANPKDARYQFYLGYLYLTAAQSGDDSKIYLADETLKRALEFNPAKQDIFFLLSQVKDILADDKEVENLLKKAVNLKPAISESNFKLGVFYLIKGRKDEAKFWLDNADKLDKGLAPSRAKKLIIIYARMENWAEIAPLYKILLWREPENAAQWHASLAATYIKLGDKQKAREEIAEAVKIRPDMKAKADAFLETLK